MTHFAHNPFKTVVIDREITADSISTMKRNDKIIYFIYLIIIIKKVFIWI